MSLAVSDAPTLGLDCTRSFVRKNTYAPFLKDLELALPRTGFTDDEYLELMLNVGHFEKLIQESIQAIDQVESFRAKMRVFGPLKPKPIGLAVDEWGAGAAIRSSRKVSHSAASSVKRSLKVRV